MKFQRGSDQIYWKSRHTEDTFKGSKFPQKKLIRNLGQDFPASNEPRGVPSSKRDNIVEKLNPLLQPTRRVFWENLPVNEKSADLAESRDETENTLLIS